MVVIAGVLLLAGGPGGLPERPAAGRVRHLDRVRRPRRTSRACSSDETYLASFRTTAVFSVLVAVHRPRRLAAAGGDGRPRHHAARSSTRRC